MFVWLTHISHFLKLEFSLSCFVQVNRNTWLLCSHWSIPLSLLTLSQ